MAVRRSGLRTAMQTFGYWPKRIAMFVTMYG